MGNATILLVLGLGLNVGLLSFSLLNRSGDAVENSADYYETTVARNIANTAVDLTIQELADSASWRDGFDGVPFDDGTLYSTLTDTTIAGEGYVKIVATGEYNGKTKTIIVIVVPPSEALPPQFLRYALSSGGNIRFSGAGTIVDDGNPTWNADIHANGNLEVQATTYVEGFGSYGGNYVDASGYGTFQPNVNPDNSPSLSKRPEVYFPEFKAEDYLGIATDVLTGNQTFTGNITLGTKENPRIIYVSGNLDIDGTVSGYGAFIVTGNIYITGDINTSLPDPQGNNLALYSNGNIKSQQPYSIRGQLYANGNLYFEDAVTIYGLASARGGNSYFDAPITIYYRPATLSLTDPFWASQAGSERPEIVSYYE